MTVLTGMLTFSIALAISFGLTPLLRRLALRLGMVDRPNARKLHRSPMPLLGGLAIYLGTLVGIMFSLDGQPRGQIFGILASGTLLLATGILDSDFLRVSRPAGALLDVAITLLWVVGVTAAFSILDHMDGLVSGVAAIASFFFALLAIMNGQVLVASLGAAVLGASLGFLRWNFKPAKIFMGDGGAMFLGFMIATLGIKLRLTETPQSIAWMVPALVLAVPIFDTTLVTISRSRRGLLPFASPGKDHTAHRLANLGLGQRGAVLVIYGVGLFFGVLAVVVSRLSFDRPAVLGVALALVALACVALFESLPYERQPLVARQGDTLT